jgi:hypothetical protein
MGPKSEVSFAYRILTATVEHRGKVFKTSKLVWDGEVKRDLRSVLAGPGDPEERSKRTEAAAWLRSFLEEQQGSVEAGEAQQAAKNAGITPRTLERARPDVAKLERKGFPAKTFWTLLTVSPSPDGDTARADDGETGETQIPQGVTGGRAPLSRQTPEAGETGAREACERCRRVTSLRRTVAGSHCEECSQIITHGPAPIEVRPGDWDANPTAGVVK